MTNNGGLLYEAKKRFLVYHKNVNWLVFTLLTLFTISSWIDIYGLWCEFPIMVHELPEGWRLPSILSLVIQIAQIGPIIFLILKWFFLKYFISLGHLYHFICWFIILFAFGIFWKKTAIIWNEERSIGMYIFTLGLGLVDGISTVAFLAYIGTTYKREYIIANYVGESLSAMIPGIAGIIQGVTKNNECKNVTIYNTSNIDDSFNLSFGEIFRLEPMPIVPNFSVSNYFLFLFGLFIVCIISFTLVHFSSFSKKQKKIYESKNGDRDDSNSETKYTVLKVEQVYGILPGMQSYATLPYGNNIFYLSIILNFLLQPVVTISSIWSYKLSSKRITTEFFVAFTLSLYPIILSILSPCPPLLDTWIGPVLLLICWLMSQNMFLRLRCCIAAKIESCGEKGLLLVGGLTTAGSAIGGILMFLLVDIYRLFNDLPTCVLAKNYCSL